MKKNRLYLPITLAAATALVVALGAPADADPGRTATHSDDALTTKAPYAPLGNARAYQKAPAGFTPVFTENVSRHGERTLSDSDDGDALLALWQQAEAQHALTRTGRSLGPDITSLLAANAKVGYGLLTQSGVDDLEGTARRMEQRLPRLFASAATSKTQKIDVVAASQQRTVDSANDFVAGLESLNPKLAAVTGATRTDDDLLYFHKSKTDPDSLAYQTYLKSDAVSEAEDAAREQPKTHRIAREVLLRSFTPAFVDKIAAGDFDEFGDEIDAADALYSLWQVTADLSDEGHWDFGKYLTPSESDWFGYLDDVTSFYENGPAFSGSDVTYKMADVLLDDMFASLDAKADGANSLDAELRFTHAEEIFPLASLLGLPGSTHQLPAGTEYSYANDTFRGAQVAPMGANIQWDLFKKGHTYLVRMLYNEKQTAFKAGCTPIAKGSYFYTLNELESCYAVE